MSKEGAACLLSSPFKPRAGHQPPPPHFSVFLSCCGPIHYFSLPKKMGRKKADYDMCWSPPPAVQVAPVLLQMMKSVKVKSKKLPKNTMKRMTDDFKIISLGYGSIIQTF